MVENTFFLEKFRFNAIFGKTTFDCITFIVRNWSSASIDPTVFSAVGAIKLCVRLSIDIRLMILPVLLPASRGTKLPRP
jgi:hypothetical protein